MTVTSPCGIDPTSSGRVGDAEQALVNETGSRLHPSGFDPSRMYVLRASQGEYSDRREWSVALYENEALAQADVILASALHRELFGHSHGYVSCDERDAAWATEKGRELNAIMGECCEENDELFLYCGPIEFRSAQLIETRRAETLGSVEDESVVRQAAPSHPHNQKKDTGSHE